MQRVLNIENGFITSIWCFRCRCSIPCKIRTGILAGSCRDLGGNPTRIPARFWRRDFSSRRQSPESPAGNSQRPKSPQDHASNLAKILAGKQKSQRPKSCRDPAVNLAKILAGKQKSWRPKGRTQHAQARQCQSCQAILRVRELSCKISAMAGRGARTHTAVDT